MKVFLDTNVFYNNWFLNSANFKYLFHFLNNEGNELIISKLVIEEANNIRRREVDISLSEVHSAIKKLKKLNKRTMKFPDLDIDPYDLKDLLQEKVDYFNVFEYGNVPHDVVVSRALFNKKPFTKDEKGYRDTLIWLSFIEYVSNLKLDEDVIFITQNSDDFYSVNSRGVKFNSDLEEDLSEKKILDKIIPYKSIHEFVKDNINTEIHAFDYERCSDIFESYVEEQAVEYFSLLDNIDLSTYFESDIFISKVSTILEVRADILEGVEDRSIESVSKLDGDECFVSYRFDLRIVILEVEIPYIDYDSNRDDLDCLFFDVENKDGVAVLKSIVRTYFDVNFVFDTRKEKLSSFSVDNLWLRRK